MKDSSLWLFSLFLFVFSHTHSFAADVPAIVDGQFRVDEMGAATYSIPIHIAPGTAGVQPSVSLNYSSANTRDSHLGVGWSIGGMSMITRCPKTIATDGQTGAVSMATVSDKFCLDGQRLILKSGTYGQDNSFYYTETDNFMQIKARKGAAKAGIGYFIVYTRAGETMCYGNPVGDPQCTTNGPDAFIEPGGSSENSAAHFWALESVEDTTGNYFFYRYKEDRSAGTFYLSQINYTRNKHTNAPDYAYVKFNYDTRKTATRSWLAGGYRFDDRLLTSIESRVDGKLYRKYTMTYESPAQAEARVLLKTIRACDASNYCTPATRFDWQRPALVGPSTSLKPFKLDQSNKRMDAESYEGVRVMDINGDGYADAVWAEHGKWRIRLGPHWTSAINTNYPYGASDIVRNHALTIDADGDGRRDLLVANRNDANYVVIKYKAKHNATSAQCPPHSSRYSCSYRNVTTSLSAIALTGRIAHGYDDGEAHVADVDGDGLEDIVYRRGGKLFAYLNTSSTSKISFSEEVEVLSLPANASSYTYSGFMSDSYSTGSVVDINGDGRTDVIARITTRTVNNRGSVSTSTNWRLYMADGTADSPSMRQEMTFGNSTLDDMRATDLNGDGLTDIVYARGNNLYYRLSTGKRLSNEYALGYSVASHLRHKMQFIDLNYDGRADFMRPINNSRYQFYIAHPTNDIDTKPALNPVSFTYRGYRDYHGDAMYFGDKNGDGNMDMFVADGRYWDIYQDDNTPKQFAINRIENGFGVGTDIDYAPMTDDTVYFSDASTNDNSIDVFSPRYGMQLVHKVHTDINRDGAGKLQRVGVKYQYGGLLMHRKGRGVLGFEYLRTTDLQTNIVTETKYAQRWASNNFATSGMPIATIQYKGNAILSVAKNTLAQSNTLHGGNGKFGAFAYVSKSEEETHQIDTGAASSWHVSTTTTTNTYNDAGSLKKSTVVVDDRNSSLRQTTTTDNAYYDGYWPKLHARLKSTTVTKSRRAGSATPTTISRTSSFSYYRDKLDHDNAGMLKEERIGVGSDYDRSTTYEYDDYGNTVNVSTTGRVDTAGKHQTRRITSNFHKSGRFLHEKCVYYATSACHKTTYKYNHKKAADASGVIETITTIAPTGMQTHTTTTRLGTLTKVKSPDGSERVTHALFGTSSFIKNEKYYVNVDNKHGSTFLSPTKKTYFDAWGRETGTATRSMHHRWHITQRFYDEDGRLKKHHQPSMDGYHANHIAYTYDSLGRPSIVEHPNGLEEEYKYLRNGSKSKTVIEKRSNGQTHYHVEQRNGIGELVTAWQYGRNADADENEDINFGSSTNPSHYSEYEYDPYGNMTLAKTHAHGKATKTSTKYDSYGYKQWTDDTIKGRWEYEYNAFGELIEQTTARNHNTIFSYDSLGRQIRRYERNEGTACWIYNDTHKKGLLTEKRLFQGSNKTCNSSATPNVKYTYTYDDLYRPYTISRTIKNEGTYTFKQHYDGKGRNYRTDYPSVRISGANRHFYVTRTYTSSGYPDMVKDNTGKVITDIDDHDRFGRINHMELGNGLDERYTYDDGNGAIKSITVEDSSTTLYFANVKYDGYGNVTSRETTNGRNNTGNISHFNETYRYDALHRLSKRTVSVEDGSSLLPNDFKTTHDIDYDDFGNITYKSGVGTYQYADSGKPTRLTKIGSRSYKYDNNGNVTTDGRNTYTYSSFDKATRIYKNSSNYSELTYGIDRELITQTKKRQEGSRKPITKTTYFGDFEVVKRTSAVKNYTEYKYYVNGKAVVIKRSDNYNHGYRFLHHDNQGSVSMVTDHHRAIIQQSIYDPFGKSTDIYLVGNFATFKHVVPTEHGYTGHEELSHVGIIHMKGRIYDPNVGRFMQADPFIQAPTNTQNHNRYSYVLNNPMSYTDPSGYFFKKLFKSIKKYWRPIVAAVVSVVTYGAASGWATSWAASMGMTTTVTSSLGSFAMLSPAGSIFVGAASGAIAGAVGGAIMTGSLKGALQGAFVAGATAGITGAQWYGELGSVQQSAITGALRHAGDRIIRTATIDRTASKITGNKFTNGADTTSFAQTSNDKAHSTTAGSAQNSCSGQMCRGSGQSAAEKHYSGNAENDAYLKEVGLYGRNELTVDEILNAGEFGFKQASDGENAFHRNGPGNENNLKFTSKVAIRESWFQRNFSNRYGRYELIVRPNGNGTYTHVTESINMGTLNRGNNPFTHFMRDVVPYLRYGNTPD